MDLTTHGHSNSDIDIDDLRRRLHSAISDLPALPQVVSRVLELTESETTPAEEIERLVRSEQALSSKFLQVVNSSYFCLSKRVTSLSQAVVILGLHQVRNLAMGISMVTTFRSQKPEDQKAMADLWESSFAKAQTAAIIARRKALESRHLETCYIAALLMDIGQLLIFSVDPRAHAYIQAGDVAERERELLGETHAQIGSRLAMEWNLPEPLPSVIAAHEAVTGHEHVPVLWCAYAADRVVKCLQSGRPEAVGADIQPAVKAWFGFSDAEWEEIGALARTELEKTAELLQLAA